MIAVNKVALIKLLCLGSLILLMDQLSKSFVYNLWFEQNIREIQIFSFLNITLVWNTGISFGLFNNSVSPYVLMALSFIIACSILLWHLTKMQQNHPLMIASIVFGAIGNIIDRFRYEAVLDFLDFHAFGYHYPAFNIADSAIVIGAILLMFSQDNYIAKSV